MDITPYWANRESATVTLASGEIVTAQEQDERIQRNIARNVELARLREVRRTAATFKVWTETAQAIRAVMAEREDV